MAGAATRLPEKGLCDIEEQPQPFFVGVLNLPGQDATQVLGGQLELIQVEKLGQGNAESSRQGFDTGEGRVPAAPLDFSNVLGTNRIARPIFPGSCRGCDESS